MDLIQIDSKYFNLNKVVAILHVPAPSGQVHNITTEIIFDFAIDNKPYKIHIDKPLTTVLEIIKNHTKNS